MTGTPDLHTFRSIVDNLREVVFQTDAQGRWTFLNRAWEEITGFSVAESIGVVFLEYVHPGDRALNQERFRPLIERKKDVCRHEVRYLTRDGGFRWIEVHARLTLDEDGRIVGTCGTLSDVTARRAANDELREARQRLEFVLASNPAVIFGARSGTDGAAWETTFMSDNARTILGHAPEAFTADPAFWLTTIHPDDLDEVRRSFAELATHGTTTFRSRSRCGDGAYRWMRNEVRLVTGGSGGPVAFGCLVDETHTRNVEESLRRHAAILEAVAFAAQRFLDAGSWRNEITAVLARLGIAARASRVHVFENLPGAGGDVHTSLRYEWTADGVPPMLGSADVESASYRASGFARWQETLARGEVIHGLFREFPAPEQEFQARWQVRSLLVVPVFAGREWWGFIAFDDCVEERDWSAAEVDALRAAAGILGAAIRRDQTESALRQNEALLRTMADASPLGLYVVDNRSDRILYFNDLFCDIWGIGQRAGRLRRGDLSNKDIIPDCISRVQDPAAFGAACAPLQDEQNRAVVTDHIAFRDGRTIRRFSTQIRDSAGTYFGRLYLFEDVTAQERIAASLRSSHAELETRVRERTADLEKLNGRLRGEIAERRAAQQALADREAHFRALIENGSDVTYVANAEAVLQYVSPTVTRILGHGAADLIGRSGLDFIDPQDRPRVAARFRQGLSVDGPHAPLEFCVRHKDGSNRVVEAMANNRLADPAVRGVVITLRDITDRRRLEEQFRQAQKMEALGRLAGGVAHDFNNLLTVICGYSELIAKGLGPDDPLRRKVGQIKRAGDRATALVQQLLAFSRKQFVKPSVLDVNEAVADLEKMLHRLIGEDVELTISPASGPVFINMDRTQFDQIVMNLSVNARDAMPDGGALSILIRAQPETGDCGCRNCKHFADEFVILAVRDTGCGMSEETKAHLFEPFFTTKEVGKGTGLGLSMVYGAVKQVGGHVCLDSELGKGTTFRVCIPRVEKTDPVGEADGLPDVRGGKETILLVEDEELVRTTLSDALKYAGYNVLEAHHGEEALELLGRCGFEIDLLVTDMVMPRMSGRELASRLAVVRPDIPVLYVSGYPRQELAPGSRFLTKPFAPDELIREVRAALDNPRLASAPVPALEVSPRS